MNGKRYTNLARSVNQFNIKTKIDTFYSFLQNLQAAATVTFYNID